MATVYRACLRGPGGAARFVALKLIHPHLCSEPGFVRLFLEETRVAMALTHRNIVQTFDAGAVGDRQFLAMELVNGPSLREVYERLDTKAQLPLDIGIYVVMEVAAALAYSHRFRPELTGQPGSVIHRDVSPSNILLSLEGDVKLADFGVARARDELAHQSTSSGMIKGKLHYMSPEQARGKAEPRSDLFALGVVLYELLTGRVVQSLNTIEDVLRGPTALVAPSQLRPELSLHLEQLMLGLLSPDPEQRPESAELVRAELAEALLEVQLKAGRADTAGHLREFLATLPSRQRGPQAEDVAAALIREALAVGSFGGTMPTTPSPIGQSTGAGPREVPPLTEVGTLRAGNTTFRVPRRHTPLLAGILVCLAIGAVGTLWLTRSWLRAPSDGGEGGGTATRQPLAGTARAAAADGGATHALRDARAAPGPDHGARAKTDAARHVKVGPRPTGRLDLNTVPWARVTIDGIYRGDTPLEGLTLPAGTHRVRLENPGRGLARTVRVRILPGKTIQQVIKLD